MSNSRISTPATSTWFKDGRDRVRVLVFGKATNFNYSVMEWIVGVQPQPANEPNYGPHCHRDYEETFLVLEGSLEFLLEEKVHVLKSRDFVRVPRNTRHGFANRSSEEVRLLVNFLPGGMEELFLKHRTDQPDPPTLQEYLREAAESHATQYEL